MYDHIAVCHSSVQEPEELTVMVKCDYCPYCGQKAPDGRMVELHIFGDQTSVCFHDVDTLPLVFCEIPESLA